MLTATALLSVFMDDVFMVDFFIESYSSVIYVIKQPHCGMTVSIQSSCQILFSVCKQAVITEISQLLPKCERSPLFLHQAGAGAPCFVAYGDGEEG
jgi:hypothetical protein